MPEQSSPSVSSGKNWEWQCRKFAEESDDMGRSVVYCLSGTERKEGLYTVSSFSRVPRLSKATPRNTFAFVKKLPQKNGNFVLALRKRLFCNAKPTLLPCKTAAFELQNNRFCNLLIAR